MKNNYQMPRSILLTVIMGIIIFLFAFFVFLHSFEKTEFKITKQECWNESEIIGERSVEEPYTITYPYRIRIYDSDGDFKDSCESKETMEYWYPSCGNSSYCHYNKWDSCDSLYCWGVEHKIYREDCNKTYQKMEDIYDTRLVCKQVEVDEIIYIHGKCTLSFDGMKGNGTFKVIDYKLKDLGEICDRDIEFTYNRTITSKNFMGYPSDSCVKYENDGKCSKYKIGDYTIELK